MKKLRIGLSNLEEVTQFRKQEKQDFSSVLTQNSCCWLLFHTDLLLGKQKEEENDKEEWVL